MLKVDLHGTALVLEALGDVFPRGAAGVVIASHSGHRPPPAYRRPEHALATTPVEELLALPLLQPGTIGALLEGPDGGSSPAATS